MDNKSIAHTRWNCTYHIVFIPKYRRKIMYGETRKDIVEILKKLCEMKQVTLIEGNICKNIPAKKGTARPAFRRNQKNALEGLKLNHHLKWWLLTRKAHKSDAKALIEYLNVVGGESDFLSFGLGEFGRSVEQEEDFIENALKKENALFIIAEINGKVIGNLNFSGGPRQRNAHTGEFGVSILKEYWRNGIGEELIKYLIDWSKSSGIIRKINLRVRKDNTNGIQLYRKLGFLEEGIIKRNFLINGEFYDSLLMGLLID